MSFVPERPRRDLGAQVRRDAHTQASRWGGIGPAIAGIAVVVFLMGAFIVLDYTFDQDPHRIFKVALGLLAIGGIMAMPKFGLLLLPVVTPFLPWVPPTPIPGVNALNVLLFAVFGTYAFGSVMARRPFMRKAQLAVPIGILVGIAILSIAGGTMWSSGIGYNPVFAGLDLFHSVMPFALYFIVLAMARGATDRRRVTWAILAGLMLESLVTLRLGRTGTGGRAIGSIGQANELGGFLAVFTVIAMAMVFGARGWFAKLFAFAIFLAGSLGVMYSVSRGAFVALLAGMIVVTWRSSRLVFVVLLLVLAASPLWLPDYVKDRITGSTVQGEGDDTQVDNASELRLLTWRAVIQVVTSHPLEGVGFGGLPYVLPDIGSALGLAEVKDSAHNTFLRILGETGIFGLCAFVWVLFSVWRLGDLGVRYARSQLDRSLAVGLCAAAVTLAVTCAFGDRFWSPVVTSSFWMMCALVEDILYEAAPEVTA